MVVSKRMMQKEAEFCCALARQNARSVPICLDFLALPFVSRQKVGKHKLELKLESVKKLQVA